MNLRIAFKVSGHVEDGKWVDGYELCFRHAVRHAEHGDANTGRMFPCVEAGLSTEDLPRFGGDGPRCRECGR